MAGLSSYYPVVKQMLENRLAKKMTKGKCTICSLNDQTLCDINYTIKQHATTVLGITEFQLKSQNINICLRCQFNLELAFKINKHVALFFKHGAKLTTECILCRRSSLYLLNVTETKENTESFVHKIAKCTEKDNINLTGQQKVCYRCLYFTDVWFDLRSGFEGEISEESCTDNNNSFTMRRSSLKKKTPPNNSKKQKISSLQLRNLNIEMNGVEITDVPRLRAKPSVYLSRIDTSKVKSPKIILPASKIIKKRRLKCRVKFDEKLMNRICLVDVSYNIDPKQLKRRGKIQFSVSENIKSPQTPRTTRTKVASVPSPIKSETPVSKRATRTQSVIVNIKEDTSSPIKSKKTEPSPIKSKKTQPDPIKSKETKPSPVKSAPVELKTTRSKPQPKKNPPKKKESQSPLPSVQKPSPKSKKKSVSLPKIPSPIPVPKRKTLKCSQCKKTFAYNYKLTFHELEHADSYSPKVEVYKSNLEQMRKLWFTIDDSSDGETPASVLKKKMNDVNVSTGSSNKNVPNPETEKSNGKIDNGNDVVTLPGSTQPEEVQSVRSNKHRQKQDEIEEVIVVPDTETKVSNSNAVAVNISDDEQESTEKTSQNENISDVNQEPNESGNINSQSDKGDERNLQLDKSDEINLQLDDDTDTNSQPDECGDENSQTNACEDSQTNECEDSQTNDCEDSQPNESEDSQPNKCEDSQANECEDSQTNECEDSQTNECEDSQTNECEDSQTNECEDLQTNECEDSQTNECEDSQPNECEDSQTNECEDSQTNECEDSQTNECKDSQTNECEDLPTNESEDSQTNECEDSQPNECDSQTSECDNENLQMNECDDIDPLSDNVAEDTDRPTTNGEENCCEINGDSDDEQTRTKRSRDGEENSENNQNFPPKKRIRLDDTCEGNETEVPNDMGNKSSTVAEDSSEETDKDVPNYASSVNEETMSMAEITETLQKLGA